MQTKAHGLKANPFTPRDTKRVIILHLRSSLIVNASRFAVGRVNIKTHCLAFYFALPLKIIRVSIKRSYTV